MPFHLNTDTHIYPTCIQHNLHQYKTKNEYAKQCILYDIPIAINEYAKQCILYDIPIAINNFPIEVLDKIDTHSLQCVAGYVKAYILQIYQETCTIVNCYICN